jgi:hypothetical protein
MNCPSIRALRKQAVLALPLAILFAPAAYAFTLPPFSPDIMPSSPSVKITSKQTTVHGVVKSTTSSFTLDTPFTSLDFPEDLGDLCNTSATITIGVAPSKNCKIGEPTLTPISIPLNMISGNSDCTSFTYNNPPTLSATWDVTPSSTQTSSPGTGNQQTICVDGTCYTCNGGVQSVTCSNGTCQVTCTEGSGTNPTPTDQLAFTANSSATGIPLPTSKVDLFILYPADGDSDDTVPGALYEGACVTLNSTSVSSSSSTIGSTTTVTRTFSAH